MGEIREYSFVNKRKDQMPIEENKSTNLMSGIREGLAQALTEKKHICMTHEYIALVNILKEALYTEIK